MGVLSNSALKAYKKGSRRAHIPEWFEPAAYVFAGIVGIFLLFGLVFEDDPAPGVRSQPVEQLVITADGATSTAGPVGNDPVPQTTPDGDGVTISVSLADENVSLIEGGDLAVPAGAWSAAQATTFALLTGDFADVPLYPGKSAPILLTTWVEPSILGLVDVVRNTDDSLEFVVRVDPDGTGTEPARDVPFILVKIDTNWVYLPG
jgi:hypothetical protein